MLEKTENLPLTIGTGENVIKVYYKKNVFTLTVKYVYAEGGTAAPDHIENVTFGEDYSVASPTIPGYVADKSKVSGTMPEKNVTKTVTYSKRTDLSYTVYYYLNGTEYELSLIHIYIHGQPRVHVAGVQLSTVRKQRKKRQIIPILIPQGAWALQ